MAASEPLPKVTLIGGDGGTSGVPRHMFHLANAFQGLAELTLISDKNEGGFDAALDVGANHIVISGLQTRRSLYHLRAGWRGLTQHLRHSDADLIWLHARLPVLMGRIAMALRVWKPTAPVAVTFHGLPFGPGHKPHNSSISKAVERVLLSLCPPLDLIFLSQSMADEMTRTMGTTRMAKHRLHVLPNCSDLGTLPAQQPGAGKRLVMTGRAGWQKNYQLAAKVLAHLPEAYTLTLCGAGTDDVAFQRDITAAMPIEAAKRIRFAGPLRDVRTALMSADGYMLCSRYEGLPIGTLEAFEAGLPVILSRFAGAKEVAETSPYTCVLDFDNLAEDAQKIDNLLTSYHAAGKDARSDIQSKWRTTWSPEVFAKRSRTLLHQLLS